jgi:TPR repeat protein
VCFCNRDHAKALNFFTTAHAATPEGHASAALHMGIMYLNGFGIEEDVDKAEMLFKFALEKGEPDAEQAMELLASKRAQQQQQQETSADSSFSGAEGTEV